MFICLDSKYSLKHMGLFQLLLLLYSQDKILCAPCTRCNIWGVAFFFPETNIRRVGILKRERETFFFNLPPPYSPRSKILPKILYSKYFFSQRDC